MKDQVVMALPREWGQLNDIRAVVARRLEGYDKDTQEAVAMVASELVENAIKYGEPLADAELGQFRFALTDQGVRIDVTSRLTSREHFDALRTRIDSIQASEDKQALYIRRMQEIYDHPGASAGLGLFRIAFEGGCALRCGWMGDKLTVTATRDLDAAEPS